MHTCINTDMYVCMYVLSLSIYKFSSAWFSCAKKYEHDRVDRSRHAVYKAKSFFLQGSVSDYICCRSLKSPMYLMVLEIPLNSLLLAANALELMCETKRIRTR